MYVFMLHGLITDNNYIGEVAKNECLGLLVC